MSKVTYKKSGIYYMLYLSHRYVLYSEETDKFDEGQEKFLRAINYALDERHELSRTPVIEVDQNFTVTDVDVSGLNLNRTVFNGIVFKNCRFDMVTVFNNMLFNECTFESCYFEHCHFVDTNFKQCIFIDSRFEFCYFVNSDIFAHVNQPLNKRFIAVSTIRGMTLFIETPSIVNLHGNMFQSTQFNFTTTQAGKIVMNRNMYSADCIIRRHNVLYELEHDIPLVCPSTGSFIAYKCAHSVDTDEIVLIKLRVPEDALRSSALGRKCRASKADVLSITNEDGSACKLAYSDFNSYFTYRVGATVVPQSALFEEDRFKECASGIHFFLSAEEAWEYARAQF